jgi:hypothetical protein
MRLPSFVSFILVLFLALIAGGVGYAIGVNSAVATTAAAAAGDGSTVVVAHAGWWGGFWFFPFFGIFFFILFFAIIFGLIRRAAWGGPRGRGGWGGGWNTYGPYGWTPRDPSAPGSTQTSGNVPPGIDQMLKDWHRDAHGPSPTPTDAQGSGRPPGTQG